MKKKTGNFLARYNEGVRRLYSMNPDGTDKEIVCDENWIFNINRGGL